MRFKIMFGISSIIIMLLIFYPQNSYLNKYENNITVNYSNLELAIDCEWNYKLSNDNIELVNKNDNTWKYKYNKDGKTTLIYYCKDDNNNDIYTVTYDLKMKDNYIYWLSGDGTGLLDFPNLY